jgi:hypothetical protein
VISKQTPQADNKTLYGGLAYCGGWFIFGGFVLHIHYSNLYGSKSASP